MFLAFKIVLAIGAALTIYLIAAWVVRAFSRLPPPLEPDQILMRPVNYRYRCIVCGTEVVMTSAPDGDAPDAPRHCREDMSLVVEGGTW